jgi:hypothetical protein
MVKSACHIKRFTAGSRNVPDISLMTKRLKQRCGSGWSNFYAAGFDALVKRWGKCINVDEG